mmetsp:Transcript_74173/g.168042  ORF Transcript_74173/g.168042 Transcript_74173/m.168042 type:complete len:194 (-) Transcript_74173:52-633(-)
MEAVLQGSRRSLQRGIAAACSNAVSEVPPLPPPPRLLVCSRTREYRRAAASALVGAGDVALEVGCHVGITTAILAERCGPSGMAIGVDRSAAAVEAARQRFPDHSFAVLDASSPGGLPAELPRLLPAGSSPTVAFLDLGGDAPLPAVLRAVVVLEQLPGLRLLVAKSQALCGLRRRSAELWAEAAAAGLADKL